MKLKIFALASALAISVVSCSNSNVMGGQTSVKCDPSSPIVKQSRKMVSVSSLESSRGVRVCYEQSAELSLVVEAPKDIVDLITTDFDGNELEIGAKANIGKCSERVKVIVKCPGIVDFEANSGSSIEIAGTYTATLPVAVEANSGAVVSAGSFVVANAEIEASSGAAVSVSGIKCDVLEGEASSGGTVVLSGTAASVDLSASSGVALNASALKAQRGEASADSGGSLTSNIAAPSSISKNSGGMVENLKSVK